MSASSNLDPILPSSSPDDGWRFPENWSLGDLQEFLGGVPACRIRLFPTPGAARELDAETVNDRKPCLVELEHGVLVEKTIGWYESLLATLLASELAAYLRDHDVGLVFGADGPFRLAPGVVKIPDVSFVRWENWPRQAPMRRTTPALAPDLVVEVLSESNTAREMAAKILTYFQAGVRMAWLIDPATRTARVYSTADAFETVERDGTISGGDLLPGFHLSLGELFARADRQPPSR